LGTPPVLGGAGCDEKPVTYSWEETRLLNCLVIEMLYIEQACRKRFLSHFCFWFKIIAIIKNDFERIENYYQVLRDKGSFNRCILANLNSTIKLACWRCDYNRKCSCYLGIILGSQSFGSLGLSTSNNVLDAYEMCLSATSLPKIMKHKLTSIESQASDWLKCRQVSS
jgi:hypothetical protein